MGSVPVSVVILTRNEAGRIRDCIASAGWAAELLVIDDGSTDDTVAIAESLGARVLRRRMDVEGRHRNWAHDQASHDWILSLDADERVTPELAAEITALFQSEPPHEIYDIPRRNHIGTRWIRHGGWYPSAQVKLFKRTVFRWEETTVHPRALSTSSKPQGALRGDLIHLTYRDLRDYVEKLNRHTSLEAEKWVLDGRRVTGGKAAWRAWDRFARAYVSKQGWRDGFLGFVMAVFGGMYQLLAWAKYIERTRPKPIEDVVAPFSAVTKDQERYDRVLLMSHLCAYEQAGRLGREKRILEIGCGSGYGAYYLSHLAKEVVAIDMDPAVIEQAPRLFRRPNLSYRLEQGTRLPFPDASFDCVASFQVIEHIPEPQLPQYLGEISRVLKPDGVFVVSTLNLDYNRKHAGYEKPSFHEKEFTAPELKALLESAFPSVDLQGLYPSRRYRMFKRLKKWGLHRWKLGRRGNPVSRFFDEELSTDHHVLRPGPDRSAIDLIAVCRRRNGDAA